MNWGVFTDFVDKAKQLKGAVETSLDSAVGLTSENAGTGSLTPPPKPHASRPVKEILSAPTVKRKPLAIKQPDSVERPDQKPGVEKEVGDDFFASFGIKQEESVPSPTKKGRKLQMSPKASPISETTAPISPKALPAPELEGDPKTIEDDPADPPAPEANESAPEEEKEQEPMTPPEKCCDSCQQLKHRVMVREEQLQKASMTIVGHAEKIDSLEEAIETMQVAHDQLRASHEATGQEYDKLRQKWVDARDGLTNMAVLKQELEEKEIRLAAFSEEGEKLSKKQAAMEQSVRQLKKNLAEAVADLKSHKSIIADLEKKLQSSERKRENLDALLLKANEENHSLMVRVKTTDLTLSKTAAAREALEQRLSKLEAENERLKSSHVDTSEQYKLVQQEKENSDKTRKQLQQELLESRRSGALVQQQLDGMRKEVDSVRRSSTALEDRYRSEKEALKEKLRQARQHSDELTASITETTQPLLRQLKALQLDSQRREELWKVTEQTIVERLQSSEAKAAALLEQLQGKDEELAKARSIISESKAVVLTLQNARTEAESGLNLLKAEKSVVERKLRELENAQSALESLKGERDRLLAAVKTLEAQLHEKALSVQTLSSSLEKVTLELEEVVERGNRPIPPPQQEEEEEEKDVFSSHRGGAPLTLEREQLQRQLRVQKVRIHEQVHRIAALEEARESLSTELVELSAENQSLQREVAKLRPSNEQHLDLKKKHSVLLELLGEKEEQVENLVLDIRETQQQYKAEIARLSERVAELESLR